MRQDTSKQIKMVQRRYKSDNEKKISNASQTIYAKHYAYMDRFPMKTSSKERLGTGLYSKLMSATSAYS